MGVATTRHVAARRVHGDEALPGDEARRELGLELHHARELSLGETPDAIVGEADVALYLLRHGFRRGRDLGLRYDDITLPTIQGLREVQCPLFAALLDVAQHSGDDLASVVLPRSRRLRRLLEISHGHGLISFRR
jgi:hypothetical protein